MRSLLIISIVLLISCSEIPTFFNNQILKDGISFGKNNGPISVYSFKEDNEINKISEIENYVQKKKRFTQDGRVCAKAFVQDGKTYFDCTKSRTPDGNINVGEWCYVDPSYTDPRNWGYCQPIIDYNRVRATNMQILTILTKDMKSVNGEVSLNITPAQKSFEDLKHVKTGQDKLFSNINSVHQNVISINNNINKLYKAKDQCDLQEKNEKDLSFKIERYQRELKLRKKDEELNPMLSLKTTDCKGMLLYEDLEEGDGLIGNYYNNENWLGNPREIKQKEINFDWTDTAPYKDINPNNFSVKWEGWIKIPVSSNYNFYIECDDGAMLIIDDEIVIEHKLGSLVNSYVQSIKPKDDDNGNSSPNEKINMNKSKSKNVFLIGGVKIKIVLKYFHSVHTNIFNTGQSFIRLSWSNDDFKEQIIPSKYLLSTYGVNPLKITNYDSNDAQMRKLHENDFAFFNSDKYILQDIPLEFINSTILKFKSRYVKNYIDFNISVPSFVYIGILGHYPNPLPQDFEFSGYKITLLQLEKTQSHTSKKQLAKKSSVVYLYKKKVQKGYVKIQFNKIGLNTKGIPMIMFFNYDSRYKKPSICSGKEKLVSLSTGKFFKKCTASSEIPNFKCEDGFSGKNRDEEGGMWAANNDGIGAWIHIKFKYTMKLTRFSYRNRKNPTERNSKLELQFTSGEMQTIFLKNNDEIHETNIESLRSKDVKITIKDVYGTLNNGGSFNFYGIPCLEEDNDTSIIDPELLERSKYLVSEENRMISPLFQPSPDSPVTLACRESLSNSGKFDNYALTYDEKIVIICNESCALEDSFIYGTDIYTKDSVICKAAFHAKKIGSHGGKVNMVIKQPITNFKGSLRNGIKSEGKYASPLAIAFENYVEEDIIKLKSGSKVDIKQEESDKWLPGYIIQVLDTNNGRFLKLALDGENSKTFEIPYPNDRIHHCGKHVKYRECKDSLKIVKEKLPVLIRFVPNNYSSDKNFLSDFGDVYGTNGKPWGWSTNMKKMSKQRLNPSDPLLETFIEFPPSAISRPCNKQRLDSLCEPVFWFVKSGKGRFKIKVYVGDPLKERKVDIKINNKVLVKNKIVEKNKLEMFEDIFESKKEFIELTSDCEDNCDKAISIVNAIEIIPYDDNDDINKEKKKEKETNCGSAFIGGRCDTGPDTSNCLFDDPSLPSAKFCNGEYALVSIPSDYSCRDQIGKYKCVMKVYSDENQCKRYCPKKCNDSKCIY